MKAIRTVLHASASLHGNIVEETFASTGEAVQFGSSATLAVPTPRGMPYVARVVWTGPATATVRDGAGGTHEFEPGRDVVIEAGPVTLHLALVERFPVRRAEPWTFAASLAWLAACVLASLVMSQGYWVHYHRCEVALTFLPDLPSYAIGPFRTKSGEALLTDHFAACFGGAAGSAAYGAFSAEYLARLLRRDYAGETEGVIERTIDRPRADRKSSDHPYLPAGASGPFDGRMGGAAAVAREPERGFDEEEVVAPKRVEEKIPLHADRGTAIAESPDTLDGSRGADAGIADAERHREPERVAAEEKLGWGFPDWYDEEDEALDDLQIQVMLHTARARLKIDPDDPDALSILSYYQYLAQDYDGALSTYDRFIELYPESAAGYNNKALVYKRQGSYQKEEGLYRVALALEPRDATAMNNLAVNLSHQGRHAEALAVMDEVQVIDPDDPYADLHRAKIYAEMGNDEQALLFLEKALAGMAGLDDVLHKIEFRQDIRIDPSFAHLRGTSRFRAILNRYFGAYSPLQE